MSGQIWAVGHGLLTWSRGKNMDLNSVQLLTNCINLEPSLTFEGQDACRLHLHLGIQMRQVLISTMQGRHEESPSTSSPAPLHSPKYPRLTPLALPSAWKALLHSGLKNCLCCSCQEHSLSPLVHPLGAGDHRAHSSHQEMTVDYWALDAAARFKSSLWF